MSEIIKTTENPLDLINLAPTRSVFEILNQFAFDPKRVFRPTLKLIQTIQSELEEVKEDLQGSDTNKQIEAGRFTVLLYLKHLGIENQSNMEEVLDSLTVKEFTALLQFLQTLLQS